MSMKRKPENFEKSLDIDMKFNEGFNPSQSKRTASKTLYDGRGRIRSSGLDACDCLNNACSGCHFPCPNCKSQKCGNECRAFRNDFVKRIYYDGLDSISHKNPNLK